MYGCHASVEIMVKCDRQTNRQTDGHRTKSDQKSTRELSAQVS